MQSDTKITTNAVHQNEKSLTSQLTSSPIPSQSVRIRPCDLRCPFWAKIVRAEEALPLPIEVEKESDIPGSNLNDCEETLRVGDVLFEGEAIHHRGTNRQQYRVRILDASGELHSYKSGQFAKFKATLKAQGMNRRLMAGSGDLMAMVRIAHAVRNGFVLEA